MKINIIFAYRFRIEGRKFARRVNPLIRVTSGDIYVYIYIHVHKGVEDRIVSRKESIRKKITPAWINDRRRKKEKRRKRKRKGRGKKLAGKSPFTQSVARSFARNCPFNTFCPCNPPPFSFPSEGCMFLFLPFLSFHPSLPLSLPLFFPFRSCSFVVSLSQPEHFR